MRHITSENIHKDGSYFVLSNGDKPEMIVFSADEAFNMNPVYIDVFDIKGIIIESYMFDGEGYINEF